MALIATFGYLLKCRKKVSRLDKILNLLHSLTDFRGFITWGRPETMSPQYEGGGTPNDNLLNKPYLDPKLFRTFFVNPGNFFLKKLENSHFVIFGVNIMLVMILFYF